MIRKEGKARWVYRCESCEVVETAVDQFRAIEAGQAHQRSLTHSAGLIVAAMERFSEAFNALIKPVSDAVAAVSPLLAAAPPNLPYGPPPRDKRIYGGK